MDEDRTLIQGRYCAELNSGYFNTPIGFLAFSVVDNSIKLKLFSAVTDDAMSAFLKSLTKKDAETLLGYFMSTLHENPELTKDIQDYKEVCETLKVALETSQREDVLQRLRLLHYDAMRVVQDRIDLAGSTNDIHADAFISAIIERASGL